MQSYKINNSYTIYVDWDFNNEMKKNREERERKRPTTVNYFENKTQIKRKGKGKHKNKYPLPIGTRIKSEIYGIGTLVSFDSHCRIMNVCFDSKTVNFIYPDAITKGFLKII